MAASERARAYVQRMHVHWLSLFVYACLRIGPCGSSQRQMNLSVAYTGYTQDRRCVLAAALFPHVALVH